MRTDALIAALFLASFAAQGQVIIADNYNVANSGSGFSLDNGINSGINPPATRLTGGASANLRYIPTSSKPETAFTIAGNKLRITPAANPGRFTFSSDGVTPFNFASALGASTASAKENRCVPGVLFAIERVMS